ncbi:maltase A3-like [Episyrphus balteatus]|uniref:maltase A3-like n=1 Tax=Episyrphus balteatus TaxID=286459 RepID=UPI00248542A7|nr:maltase A3-like [Episyrphus balteatus]
MIMDTFRIVVVCTILMPGCILTCQVRENEELTKDWWQTAQFYQIYPRSFMDSNGDGIGDLNGITSKLEYLNEIGVTAAWLSPIFKSPMFDFGYDISSFYDIQDEYGTIDDFKKLIAKANRLGLKIILDFVPNHASTESKWFKKSVKREKNYEDFFVWHDGYENPNGGNRLPPSNWLQAFRGSAWEWNAERKQFYLHQYTVQQADLNYRNPLVVEEMKRVLRFWLEIGVAGFRIDAVPMLFEALPDINGRYLDEPPSGITNDPENSDYLKHLYTQDQPETLDMVYQWRTVMDDFQRIHGGDTRVLLIETYSPASFTMKIYGNRTTKGAHLPFNFNLITMLNKGFSATDLSRSISSWWDNMPPGQTANWVIGNHDKRRASSRYGEDLIDTMNMLVMMLPGASITYQGEELGMPDGIISWEDSVDPAACNSNKEIFEEFTRDPARTPFQWSDAQNAGFSTAAKTWLPIAAGYETINVEAEKNTPTSHLNIYKALVRERKNRKLLQFGDLKFKAINEKVFLLERSFTTGEKLILIANVGNQPSIINVDEFDSTFRGNVKTLILNLKSTKTEGTVLPARNLQLSAYEALVIERA